ncbi:MAG: glutathione S-transferase [Alphaproteobacteria bacterium]|nr:glutathione S-transferase [Alphaproteobacteria bacterium]
MLKVHHLNESRSQRVLWLLEELGVPYEIVFHTRDVKTRLAPTSLTDVHPLGKSPVIVDGTAGGDLTVIESGAIIDYIIRRHGEGRLAPDPASADYDRYQQWLHYAEGSAMTPLLLKLIFTQIPKRTPLLIRPIANGIARKVNAAMIEPQLAAHAAWWEAELGKSEWFAGDAFSAADIMMSFPVEAAGARVGFGADKPRLKAFLQRIHARPAYRRALERGGPYAYA